ncbi:carboxypeptidase regulatory-like domain-containing protein [Bacterioplanoides sp. SCSIO 12839]|uniref:carboxypeptidase regulatory-like domain-containing protein n=1 Tax=Bacterioplanoides sp. SCSIO 12839 TaxID=2829569 RepID=UPI0021037968|nr:carboxypeptidase regulatory-like domain-containing protein [Bacterioplanoides sp. SCSIO 12839]UTW47589.1 carboxypeptidase regulatory-like domain-containing protein [Bacterioplanoides sp. SCSIO 12839]
MAIWLRAVVSFLIILSASFSFANSLTNEERISKGTDWLLTQQFVNESFTSDLALDWQATDEVVTALKAGSSWDQLAKQSIYAWWVQESTPYLEYRARSINIAENLGETSVVALADLIAYQNVDGGFSAYDGWESNPYSTAQALSKLPLIDDTYRSNIVYAIGYLRESQQADGSFLTHQNESSLVLTAQVLIALKSFQFEYDISATLAKLQDYILAELANASDYPVNEVAIALQAIIPVTTDTARYQAAVEYITSSQQENGSWNDDAYTSALALQTLQMIENVGVVTDPLKATLQGRIYIINTNTALANATVTIEGTSDSVTTDASGQFKFNNLEQGEYTFIYSASDYYSASQQLTLKAGQLADVGSIYLAPLPTKGIVKGVMTSAETGLPLQGVTVNVAGANQYSAVTAVDGSYQIEVMPGAISFNTSFDGYQAVSGSADIEAGGTLLISASLYKVDDELPADVTLKGRVLNQDSQGIAEAQLTVNGALVGQTDASGEFMLTGLEVGAIALQISATNYKTTALNMSASQAGEANVGDIVLKEYIALAASTIKGKIIDENAQGIPFADLVFNQLDNGDNPAKSIAVKANQYGEFEVVDVDFLSIGLTVSAEGFVTKSQSLKIAEHGEISLADILLERTPVVEVTKISGQILNKADSTPIPFAEILFTQLDVPANETPILVNVTADSNGEYTVENIEFYRMQAFVTATGYQSLIQELTLQKFDKVNVDFELQPYVAGFVSISEFNLDQAQYPAYSQLTIKGTLVNTDVAARRVKVQADIKNSAGDSIQQILMGDEKDLAGKPLPITVVPNSPIEVEGEWFTGISQPGRYEIVLSLYDPLTDQILTRKSNFIEIIETADLNNVSVLVSPKVSKVGAQEELNINVVAKYFGNVASTYALNYELVDPDDQVISSGSQDIDVVPGDISKAIQLPVVNVEFNMSGRFLLRGSVAGNPLDVVSDWIVVAPSTRIDVSHELSPAEVLPGTDKQLKVEVKLQGVEQP